MSNKLLDVLDNIMMRTSEIIREIKDEWFDLFMTKESDIDYDNLSIMSEKASAILKLIRDDIYKTIERKRGVG